MSSRVRAAYVLAAVLAAVALVLFLVRPDEAEGEQNVAVVDTRQTAEVVDEVTEGLEGVFAYDFRAPEESEAAAEAFLSAEALEDYQELRETVSSLGEEQSLVYEAEVTRVGVQRLVGDEATALAFLAQTSTRGSDGAVEEAPAQLLLELERVDDAWQVASFDLL